MIACTFENGGQASLRHVVVDCLILKDGKILLVKRAARLLEGGKWGLAGGFAERDETMAQAATREVLEETGWQIKDLTLIRVIDNPERPHEDRENVVFVYFATATQKTGEPDNESDEQRWFALSELPPPAQIAFDHLGNINLYREYLGKPFILPVIGTT